MSLWSEISGIWISSDQLIQNPFDSTYGRSFFCRSIVPGERSSISTSLTHACDDAVAVAGYVS